MRNRQFFGVGLWVFLLIGSFALSACDQNDGTVEKAGEQVDEAIQDTKNAVEDATD